ncbi:MAG: DMT family transporter [Exilispira sp.]|jgi:drug/metabolite transporter (DMT)-like permease|nr:DMT family transporter [Exilispira sp.]
MSRIQTKFEAKYLIMTVFAPILWSLGGLGVRAVSVNSWTIIFTRSISMSITISILCLFLYKKNFLVEFKNLGFSGFIISIFLGATTFFYILSLSKTTVANALLVQGTAPIWAAIFATIILKEKFKIPIWITIFCAFIGMLIIVFNKDLKIHLLGDFYALLTAFGLAFQILLVRNNPHINLIPATVIGGLIAAFFSLFFKPSFNSSCHDILILVGLGAFQIGLGYILFYRGSRYLPTSLTGLITLLETILGPIWVYLVFKEKLNPNSLIGGSIILLSLAINTILTAKYEKEKRVTIK